MDILTLIFRIGVILGIFTFLWGLIRLALVMLFPGFGRDILSAYFLRGVQYLFIVQTTLLFCFADDTQLALGMDSIFITGLILLFYFVSKFQRRSTNRLQLIGLMGSGKNILAPLYKKKAELIVLILGILFFITFLIYSDFLFNPLTIWFKNTIIGIEQAPIFGFLFKIVGFFFVVNVLSKTIQALLLILQPKKETMEERNENDFDDYEEIKD